MAHRFSLEKWTKSTLSGLRVPGPLLMSVLMADLVMPRGGSIWQGSLIEIAQLFGLSDVNVRSVLFRMTQDKLVVSTAYGRRRDYAFSDKGAQFHDLVGGRIYLEKPLDKWKGDWQFLMVDPDVSNSSHGVELEGKLRWRGFVKVGEHTYLRPVSKARPDGGIDSTAALLQYGKVFDATCLGHNEPEHGLDERAQFLRLLQREWNVAEAIRMQEWFLAKYTPVLNGLKALREPLAEEESLVLRVLVALAVGRVRVHEPRIPPALFPPGWRGDEVTRLAGQIYELVLPQSEAWMDSHARTTIDGKLPPLDAEFFDRFGGIKRPKGLKAPPKAR